MASWIENIKRQFTITMGDGAVYKPLQFNANRSVEYNFAEFDFRNLNGTLVDRRRRRGTVYNLELVFQGDDNLVQATAFQNSANNSAPWTISHPFYGKLYVQPIAPIYHDNGNRMLNTTRITTTVRETLLLSALTNSVNPVDTITTKSTNTNRALIQTTVTALPKPSVTVIGTMDGDLSLFQQALANAQDAGSIITNAINASRSAVKKLYTSVNTVVDDLTSALELIQTTVNLPAELETSIYNKVQFVSAELVSLYQQAADLSNMPVPAFEDQWRDLKNTWLGIAGSCVSAMCLTSITNIGPGDYTYSSQAAAVIATLLSGYNSYLGYLDAMQTPNGGELDSFIPDPDAMIVLDDLVNYTIDTLFQIQANSKQPRVITLTRDNNVILIARELYGLVADDSTVAQIIADNNICNSEIFQVPKGRQILYYV